MRTTLRRTGPGAPPEAQLGAVSFFHRFGSSLNVHPRYHVVVLDGVFGEAGSEIEFHEACDLTPDHIEQVESASAPLRSSPPLSLSRPTSPPAKKSRLNLQSVGSQLSSNPPRTPR